MIGSKHISCSPIIIKKLLYDRNHLSDTTVHQTNVVKILPGKNKK